jgi:hypothetical protein
MKSLRSFVSSPLSVEEFYLVINRHNERPRSKLRGIKREVVRSKLRGIRPVEIKDNPLRFELNAALSELVSAAKPKKRRC